MYTYIYTELDGVLVFWYKNRSGKYDESLRAAQNVKSHAKHLGQFATSYVSESLCLGILRGNFVTVLFTRKPAVSSQLYWHMDAWTSAGLVAVLGGLWHVDLGSLICPTAPNTCMYYALWAQNINLIPGRVDGSHTTGLLPVQSHPSAGLLCYGL